MSGDKNPFCIRLLHRLPLDTVESVGHRSELPSTNRLTSYPVVLKMDSQRIIYLVLVEVDNAHRYTRRHQRTG